MVAVDGGEEGKAGDLAQVVGRRSRAVQVAACHTVGQAEIREDDPLPKVRVTGPRVGPQPTIDQLRCRLVPRPDTASRQVVALTGGGGTDRGHRWRGRGQQPTSTGVRGVHGVTADASPPNSFIVTRYTGVLGKSNAAYTGRFQSSEKFSAAA